VLAAGAGHADPDAHGALATLCETYWYPLYAFLRSRGHSAADAQDLTQRRFGIAGPFDFDIHPTNLGHMFIAREFEAAWEGLR
jgi:RNA polymerase sigma-70 factor (ECF subfamily)